MATEKQIGKITHFYDKIQVAVIELSDKLKKGNNIHIKGGYNDFKQKVESMQLNHKPITEGKKGQEIAVKVDSPVHKNDKVFLVE